jgi:FtsP/CotA-like multicopper oxidase with cupredoxin domain
VRPISRRQALALGGLGLVSAAVGGTGLLWPRREPLDPRAGAPLTEPEVLRSEGGHLGVRLEAVAGPLAVGGRQAVALGYNGSLPGPTLRLRPGDRLQVELVNRLDDVTNLHVHGLHVSPEGSGDNVFVAVEPGGTFHYDYRLPDDHPPGVYWYHPHHHGMVADQLSGGLYGAIVVADPTELPVTRERVLVISDISLDEAGRLQQPSLAAAMMGREGDLVLVNGQVRPSMTARPGERERWRVINACTSRFVRLRLDGQQLDVLGFDSGRYPGPRRVEEIVLAPGNRADLLVTMRAGSSSFEVRGVDRGGMGAMGRMGGMAGGAVSGDVGAVAALEVAGDAVPGPAAVAAQLTPRDLRGIEPAVRRRLVFGMGMGGGAGMGGMSFTIDGRQFDPGRVDQAVTLGTVEEWVVVNASPMDHPLHLHVWPMQVVAEDDRPVEDVERRDVVNVRAGGRVTVRVAFEGFGGRTVYHCHILDHEDRGMMGVIEAR